MTIGCCKVSRVGNTTCRVVAGILSSFCDPFQCVAQYRVVSERQNPARVPLVIWSNDAPCYAVPAKTTICIASDKFTQLHTFADHEARSSDRKLDRHLNRDQNKEGLSMRNMNYWIVSLDRSSENPWKNRIARWVKMATFFCHSSKTLTPQINMWFSHIRSSWNARETIPIW